MRRESLPDLAQLLSRARLDAFEEVTPARVALAIRAELWHGTLEGARTQAQRGATDLAASAVAWSVPALLYLGLGRPAVAEVVSRWERTIADALEGCRAVAAATVPADPIEAAASLLELIDVLGPLVWASSSPALTIIADETMTLTAAVAAAAANVEDRPSMWAATRAGDRLRGWRALGIDGTDPVGLITSYDVDPGETDWDFRPRLELIVARDVAANDPRVASLELRSLPPVLKLRAWSAQGTVSTS